MNRCVVLTMALIICASTMFAYTDNFDSDTAGKPPAGWTATKTGSGEPRWTVESDGSAPSQPNVLKQSGEAAFPVCIKDDTSLLNGFVEVKFMALGGKTDQAAGVIWRCKDADNYLIARANALEDNVVLYKVVNGKRTALDLVGRKGGYGVEAEVPPHQWHTLRVEFKGDLHTVVYDGKKLFDVKDSTFAEAGKVGVWTKADSVTAFDDFEFGE